MIKNNKRKLWIISITIVVIALTLLAWKTKLDKQEFVFTTATVEKGNISNTITATGTLEATNTVVVGTQVSGVIEKLYVDFNSAVKKGQLIAELDKSTLQSSLQNAEADVEKALAGFEYQESNLARNKVLYDKNLLAKSEYDLILYNYKTSKAEVKSAKANLNRAQRNLSYASIYSPIDGIVLNRAVEEGQTVTSSMSTPELFTITNDMSSMQVEADIDEADIGQLKLGQRVEFTVDAFPDLNFSGEVSEIRLQPTESSNVITYVVIIAVKNLELKLKPGMTASITTYVEEANDVLLIEGKAIRFTPDRQLLDEYVRSISEEESKPMNEPNAINNESRTESPHKGMPELDDDQKIVWVKNDNNIHPMVIEVGINDGSNIEVVSGLEEGSVIVTSFELINSSAKDISSSKNDDGKSPFIQEGNGNKGGGGPPPH